MSFESKMKNRGNKNLDKFAKNPYHVSWIKRVPLWSKVAVPATLVATSAALVVVFALPKNKSNKAIPNQGSSLVLNNSAIESMPANSGKEVETAENVQSGAGVISQPSSQQASSDVYYVAPWDERTIYDQYRMVRYNSINYYCYQYPSVEEQYIGELLTSDLEVTSVETTYENNNPVSVNHETTAALYEINGFDSSYLLAVRFNEDDGYYWYKNITDQEQYATLGDFLDKVDLNQVASFPYAFYDFVDNDKRVRYQYDNLDKSQVMNNVFADPDVEFKKEVELPGGVTKYYSQYTNYISVPIYMPRLHLTTSSNGASGFSFYDNGFMELTFLNKKDLFYIGEENYQTLKDYILANLEGEVLPNYYPN